MNVWRPVRSLGAIGGILFALLCWLGAVFLALQFPGSLSGRSFWYALGALLLFSLGTLFIYWSFNFYTLRYTFDRNSLQLYWGGTCQILPMNQIKAIRPWQEGERVRERGLHWPGYHRGRGQHPELGPVYFYATAGRSEQFLLRLEDAAYVISPRDPDTFVREVELRRNLGVTRQLQREKQYNWILGWTIWGDRAFWRLLLLGLLVNLSLVGFLSYLYPVLPSRIPMHYREIGDRLVADVIGRSWEIFKLPAFGLVVLGANFFLGLLLHRRYRLLALLLQVTSLLVQVFFWVGALSVLYH